MAMTHSPTLQAANVTHLVQPADPSPQSSTTATSRALVGTNDFGFELTLVRQRDQDLIGTIHHMGIGQRTIAVGGQR